MQISRYNNTVRVSPKVCHILLLKIICHVKNNSFSNNLLFQTWQNEKKGNRQHASREKSLFLWSVHSMQAERGFVKSFPKLPYMHGEKRVFAKLLYFAKSFAKLLERCFKCFCQKLRMPTPFAKLLEML